MSKPRRNDITREKVAVCTGSTRRGTLEASTSICFIVRVLALSDVKGLNTYVQIRFTYKMVAASSQKYARVNEPPN